MTDAAGKPQVESGKLNPVLAEYIRRRERGEAVDVESLCQAHPDLADALRSYAAGEGLVEALAGDADPSVVDSAAARDAETLRPGAAQKTDQPAPGAFGKYQILRTLGEGAMGAIYLARDTKLDRDVALKVPKFKGIEGPEFRQRFSREARAAAKLDHPGICRVYDADEVDGTPFICMAYLDGQPLSRFVGTPEFQDQRRVAEVIREIASALAHAHQQGVLHRDLKPGNVMLLASGAACVTDFGLARHVNAGEESRLTHEGTILGTPAYMSPEQIEGHSEKIGPGTDIYALGVMLYELLASRLPFTGPVMAMLGKALRDRPTPLCKLRSDVHRELEDLCLQMLEKSADKRPASMQEVVNRLETWLKHTSPKTLAAEAKAQKDVDTLESMKGKILDLIQRGQFAAAVSGLEKMTQVKVPGAAAYVQWARTKIREVKQAPKQLREGVPALVATARQCFDRHDYAQAAQLLQDIPQDFRTAEAQQLLEECIELQDEADLLLADLQDCVKRKQFQGIESNLKRFLQLKPGNKFAKELQESLQTYSKVPWKQRKYRFDDRGRLLPKSSALADNWLLWGAACFALVFGAAYLGITIYLKDDSQTIRVDIDPQWLAEQGSGLTLDIDGKDQQTLAGPGFEIKLAPAEHSFTVRSGDTVVHNPQTLTIEKAGRQVLRIDRGGIALIRMESDETPAHQPTLLAAHQWIDVLALVDPQRDRRASPTMWTGENNWQRAPEELTYASDGKNGKLRLPVAIAGLSLEYDIEFTLNSLPNAQAYGFSLSFPARTGPLPLKLELAPATGVVTVLAGTQQTSPFQQTRVADGQRKRLQASLVRQSDGSDQLTVAIDGQSLGTWTGDRESIAYSQFKDNAEWNERALDVDVFMGNSVTFHAIKLKVLEEPADDTAVPAHASDSPPAVVSTSPLAAPLSGEIDLLAALDPPKMGDSEMTWERKGTTVVGTGIGPAGKSNWKGFRFPTEIGGDYVVELDFLQRAFWPVQIDFPLQDAVARIHLDGDTCGWMIDADKSQPAAVPTWTNPAVKLKTNVLHQLVVRVRQYGTRADVEATLDGVTVGTFSGERSRFNFPEWVKPNFKQVLSGSLCNDLSQGYMELRRAVYRPLRDSQPVAGTDPTTGWTDLFNGRDLAGWEVLESFPDPNDPRLFTTHRPSTGGWDVRNGVLLCNTDRPGLLRSSKEYGDFQLTLNFKLSASGNSGIYIRTPASGHPAQVGMEIQLIDEDRPDRGGLSGPEIGSFQQSIPATTKAARPVGNWNSLDIRCQGDVITVRVNDVTVNGAHMGTNAELKNRPRRGYIGIANWRGLAKGCEFRNIRIRENPSTAASATPPPSSADGWTDLFNGRDLAGWKSAGNTDWRVAGGVLTSDAGPRGVLWTEQYYGDFELDFEFKLSTGANSGVFLRSPENSEAQPHGFKIQLQDDPNMEDNVREPQQRTGSIYSIVAPRVETYRSGEWNRMLIRLFGRQLIITLNGQEVQHQNLDQLPFPADRGDAHRRAAGYIGLQTFGGKNYSETRDSKVEFRNARVRRLNFLGEPTAAAAPAPAPAPAPPDDDILVLDDIRVKRLKTVFDASPMVVQSTNSPFGYVPIVNEVKGLPANAFQVRGTTARRDSAWGFVVMPADRKSDIFVYLRGDGRLSVTENVAATVLAKPVDITLSLDDRDHELAVVIEPRQFRVFVDGKSVAPPIPFQRDLKTDQVALLKVGAGDAEFRNLVIGQRLP